MTLQSENLEGKVKMLIELDDNGNKERTYHFNEKGICYLFEKYKGENVYLKNTFTFDKNSNLHKRESYTEGNLSSRDIFDENENVIDTWEIYENVMYHTIYQPKGEDNFRVIEYENYKTEKIQIKEWSAEEWNYSSGECYQGESEEYESIENSSGLKIGLHYFLFENEVIRIDKNIRNAKGQVIERKKFDSKKNMKADIYQEGEFCRYNEYNDEIESICIAYKEDYVLKRSEILFTYEYQYDKFKNWTEKKTFRTDYRNEELSEDKHLTFIYKRELEYYL